MFSQVNRSNQMCRAVVLMVNRGHLSASKVKNDLFTATTPRGHSRTITHSITVNSSNSDGSMDEVAAYPPINTDEDSPLDKSLSMRLISMNLQDKGLKASRNRDRLIADFYKLSKDVMEDRLNVDEFIKTRAFNKVQRQLEYSIDIMNNAHIINLLASAIKMRINPSTKLVKLLEHEVKFRLNQFSSTQILKLLKFYNSGEISSEQRLVADMLSNRIRSCIQFKANSVEEFNILLNKTATQDAPSSLLGLVEERLLNLFVTKQTDDLEGEDQMLSRYLPQNVAYDHQSLCNLFIEIARNKRRPTPLLNAVSRALCNTKNSTIGTESVKLDQKLIISTMNALVTMNFTVKPLVSRLISDLIECLDLNELDNDNISSLLRTLAQLRWRTVEILEKISSHISEHADNPSKIDHNVVQTFLYVIAIQNFQVEGGIERFYNKCMAGQREEMLDKMSRKWLTYVWSLATLGATNETHIRSVLSQDFYRAIIKNSTTSSYYSDMMKLLNLRALATHGLKLDRLDCDHLSAVTDKLKIQRDVKMTKFAAKMKQALEKDLDYEVRTPFGFTIDCELVVDENFGYHKIDPDISLKNNNRLSEVLCRSIEPNLTKCALIYASYGETIVNAQAEVNGLKQIVSRILKIFGYKTIFLIEPILSVEKTSAEFVDKINMTIKEGLQKQTLS